MKNDNELEKISWRKVNVLIKKRMFQSTLNLWVFIYVKRIRTEGKQIRFSIHRVLVMQLVDFDLSLKKKFKSEIPTLLFLLMLYESK